MNILTKATLAVLLLPMLLSFSSCEMLTDYVDKPAPQEVSYFTLDADIEKLAEKILQAFDDKDVDALKDLFCEKSKALPDFDKQIQAAIDLYEGEMISYDDSQSICRVKGGYVEKGKTIRADAHGEIQDVVTSADRSYDFYYHCHTVSKDKEQEGISGLTITDNESGEDVVVVERNYSKL